MSLYTGGGKMQYRLGFT